MVYEHDFVVFCVLIVLVMYSDRYGCIKIFLFSRSTLLFLLQLTHHYWSYFFSWYHNTIIIVSTILLMNIIIIIMINISMIIINVIIKLLWSHFIYIYIYILYISVIITSHIYILDPIFDLHIFSYSNVLIFCLVWCAPMPRYVVVLRSHRLAEILHHFADSIEDVYCVNAYCV